MSVFYLPIGSAGPTLVGTSIPADFIRDVKENNPKDQESIGVVVLFPQARASVGARWALPHEMGHILLDDSRHASDGLMSSPAGAGTFGAQQCERIRSSLFVRRPGGG